MTDKENTGFLFKNDKKEKETHKDYRGTARVAGKDYWLSAWIKESEKSGRYLSIAFDEMAVKEL